MYAVCEDKSLAWIYVAYFFINNVLNKLMVYIGELFPRLHKGVISLIIHVHISDNTLTEKIYNNNM